MLGPAGWDIDERYVACVPIVLPNWFPGYLVLFRLAVVQLRLTCVTRLHLTLTDGKPLDWVLTEWMDCSLIHLAPFDLSKTCVVTVYTGLVHLGLIHLFYLTWKYFRWVDRGVFVNGLTGSIHLIVGCLALAYLVLFPCTDGCRVRLPHAPGGATVDIFLIDLDQAAVGTRHPVSRWEDLDIANR